MPEAVCAKAVGVIRASDSWTFVVWRASVIFEAESLGTIALFRLLAARIVESACLALAKAFRTRWRSRIFSALDTVSKPYDNANRGRSRSTHTSPMSHRTFFFRHSLLYSESVDLVSSGAGQTTYHA